MSQGCANRKREREGEGEEGKSGLTWRGGARRALTHSLIRLIRRVLSQRVKRVAQQQRPKQRSKQRPKQRRQQQQKNSPSLGEWKLQAPMLRRASADVFVLSSSCLRLAFVLCSSPASSSSASASASSAAAYQLLSLHFFVVVVAAFLTLCCVILCALFFSFCFVCFFCLFAFSLERVRAAWRRRSINRSSSGLELSGWQREIQQRILARLIQVIPYDLPIYDLTILTIFNLVCSVVSCCV